MYNKITCNKVINMYHYALSKILQQSKMHE